MTINELKKMKRDALIEHAASLARENESLAGQVEKLQAQLKEARDKLKSRTIAIGNAGSIAEASLQLNGVFEAAQASATQYLENLERLTQENKAEMSGDGDRHAAPLQRPLSRRAGGGRAELEPRVSGAGEHHGAVRPEGRQVRKRAAP